MHTNRKLMANGIAGQEKSGTEDWIKQFYPSLHQYCRFLAKNSWDGDDLAQETALKVIRHYPSSDINSALLKKVAYHNWVDALRKRRKEVAGIPENLPVDNDRPIENSILDTVEQLMAKFTAKQTVIFILKEAFRYQSGEIAELLGTTETAVKAALHRARKRLAKGEAIRPVDVSQNEGEKQLLSSLLCESIQAEDPAVLIEILPEILSPADSSKPVMAMHSRSTLSSFVMAA